MIEKLRLEFRICHQQIKYFLKKIEVIRILNKAIKKSLGKYIARQDADDLSFPERIENQVNTFENDSSLVLLGTRAKINFKGFIYESPSFTDAEINNKLKRNNVFVHSSVMYRSYSFKKIGMYNELFKFVGGLDCAAIL